MMNGEGLSLAGSSLFLGVVSLAVRSGTKKYSWVFSFLDISIPTNLILISALALTSLPPFMWNDSRTSASAANNSAPNLVWIVFDELGVNSLVDSNGEINKDFYPGFDSLRRTATWYSNTITPHTWTVNAVPSLLTGTDTSRVANLPGKWIENLPSEYHRSGFSGMGLPICSADSCVSANFKDAARYKTFISDLSIVVAHKFFPEPISQLFPPINNSWVNFGRTPSRVSALDTWLNNLESTASSDSPFVSVVHSLITHHPWVHDGMSMPFISESINYGVHNFIPGTCDDAKNFQNFYCSDDLMKLNKRIYSVNALSADETLSRVIDVLKKTKRFDSTMIVVTADHGFSFATNKDGRRIAPSDVYWQDLVKVPLFVKYPNQQTPEKVDSVRTTLQILQTVIDVLDLPPQKSIAPSLDEAAESVTVDGSSQSVDWPEPSRWIIDGGSTAEVENPDYPMALGPLADLMGRELTQFSGSVTNVSTKRLSLDRTRDASTTQSQLFRNLIGGYFPSNECPSGLLAIIDRGRFVGTAHRYKSFTLKDYDGFWGVAQAKVPVDKPEIVCAQ
jgi:hypothetical protein